MFFSVLDKIGIRGRAMAKEMGYSYQLFSLVRRGHQPASERFQIVAVASLRNLGIINPATGRWYTRRELFGTERGQ